MNKRRSFQCKSLCFFEFTITFEKGIKSVSKPDTVITYGPTVEYHHGGIRLLMIFLIGIRIGSLWDVDVVEVRFDPKPQKRESSETTDLDLDLSSLSFHLTTVPISKENDQSDDGSSKNEGRIIFYRVVDDDWGIDDAEGSFLFKGNCLEDLRENLEEETELENITVCSRNPLNGKLYPPRLALPPNNTTMSVVVVPATSKAQRNSRQLHHDDNRLPLSVVDPYKHVVCLYQAKHARE